MAARDFCPPMNPLLEWESETQTPASTQWLPDKNRKRIVDFVLWSTEDVIGTEALDETIADRFFRLADEWTKNTSHISSASDLINDRRYQEIVRMGWEVVPHLLTDLERNKRFWFPALAEITGVRPFDSGDKNNPRRMAQAWIRWGKWKGLI